MTVIRRLKAEIGIFNIFLNIAGAGARPKHRHRNPYKFPAQRNRTKFRESLCRGRLKYSSFRSILHMQSLFCNRYELIQIPQIYDCLVSAFFFADQEQTAVKFPFSVTNFWNRVLFQHCLHFQIYLFLLLLIKLWYFWSVLLYWIHYKRNLVVFY